MNLIPKAVALAALIASAGVTQAQVIKIQIGSHIEAVLLHGAKCSQP